MRKRVACLHAHYSNIDYIESALAPYDIEFIHFVDPGLMYRVTHDERFNTEDAQNKVKEQIEWMAQCNVDGILITCTNYIALLRVDELSIPVPIIKIDEPYFETICNRSDPQIILFSNPATVAGTMERLHQYAELQQKSLNVEVMVIYNTFELFMKGQKQEYNQQISKFLQKMIKEDKIISVAQLSMVAAAQEVEQMTAKRIINPLDTLISSLVNQLKIDRKS
ncbi:hypothetical protein [Neobacillus niacini]|uniref:hypothetical protein n=1 Tax=Neobacillus niacini TaxID=86668 RepID=UPI0021CAFFF0|nr:hypothetical protein [Neobacillus niacini]MCM3767051.1 hypothetical protein [Neobacillus niacini]